MIELFILLTTPVLSAETHGDALDAKGLLANATESYRAGLEARADAAKAGPLFRKAAESYEHLWRLGHHHPALAKNMAQANLLAGDLASGIRAYQIGLRIAPSDRELRAGLGFAREQIAYPVTGNLAESCRPRERKSPLRYASLDALLAICAGFYFLGFLAGARAWMTRRRAWWVSGGALFAGAIALGGWVGWEEDRVAADNRLALAIVAVPGTPFQRGNGTEYPHRLPEPLPVGVELHVLSERGGWLQVQLAGGEIGWVHQQRVVKVE